LARRAILVACPERVCATCWNPAKRVLESTIDLDRREKLSRVIPPGRKREEGAEAMSEENKAIARRALEEVFSGQGDLYVADELFASNYVGHDLASPEDIRGPEGVKEFASMYRNAFPDVQMSVQEQVAEGDLMVTRWIASGTHQGDIMGIAPTGNRVVVSGTSVERIVDGQIEETWDNYDALGMMQQIGAIPSLEEAQA